MALTYLNEGLRRELKQFARETIINLAALQA
jgi:hypothetical protein